MNNMAKRMTEQEEFVLEKPKIKNELLNIFSDYYKNRLVFDTLLKTTSEKKYKYWDKFKYIIPIEGLNIDECWQIIKFLRKTKSNNTPISTEKGEFFTLYRQNKVDKICMEFDKAVGGTALTDSQKNNNKKYIISGIMEEAIASSLLEGANTSRAYAKKMLTEKIKPKNSSERMIVNHHNVLSLIDTEWKDKPLSKQLLLEIQNNLTANTVEQEDYSGRFRKDSDEIIVQYKGKIIHTPPKEDFLLNQLDELIKYANNENDEEYIHPLIKASILHFWLGYLHPFCDGNGRTARTIFYWYLLKQGYWGVYYLPISATLKKAKKQYSYAYIYSEQDDNDLTYFIDFLTTKIMETINDFNKYVNKKANEQKEAKRKALELGLNDRQASLLMRLKNEDGYTTIKLYSHINNISSGTAKKDLKELKEKGLLIKQKKGKEMLYILN